MSGVPAEDNNNLSKINSVGQPSRSSYTPAVTVVATAQASKCATSPRSPAVSQNALDKQKKEKLWSEEILPNWAKLRLQAESCRSGSIWKLFQTNRLDGYILDGVPPNVRGEAWKRLIPANQEKVSLEEFQRVCEALHGRYGVRVSSSKSDSQGAPNSSSRMLREEGTDPAPVDSTPMLGNTDAQPPRDKASHGGRLAEGDLVLLDQARAEITKDLQRTYHTLGFFHDGGDMAQALEVVLLVYVAEHPEKGYMQGMSFLAGSLLLYMDAYSTYCSLDWMTSSSSIVGHFLMLEMPIITAYVNAFKHFFQKALPKLYLHFEKEMVSSQSLLMDWVMSLFAKALPLSAAMRVWDLYFYWGEIQIMRTAIGVLTYAHDKLLRRKHDAILALLLRGPENFDKEKDLLTAVQQVNLPQAEYDRVWKKNTASLS